MLAFLVRRLFFAAVALLAVVVIDYAMFGNLWHQLDRAFLHFDFGDACSQPGCPPVREMWARGAAADVYLLAGSLVHVGRHDPGALARKHLRRHAPHPRAGPGDQRHFTI